MVMILRIDPHVERVKLTDVYGGSAHGNVICRLISSPRSEVSHFDKVELTFGRQDILFQEYDIEDQKTVFAYEFASMKDVIFVGNGLILPWSGERLDAPSTSAIEYEREITFLGEIDNPTYDEDHQLHQDERRIPKLGLESRKHEAVSLHFRGWRNDEIAKHLSRFHDARHINHDMGQLRLNLNDAMLATSNRWSSAVAYLMSTHSRADRLGF